MELIFYWEKEIVCTFLALKEKFEFIVQYALFSRIFWDGLLDTKYSIAEIWFDNCHVCIYICSKKWPTIFSFLTTTLILHTHFSKQIDPSSSQLAFQCCSIETSEIGTWRDWNMFLQGSLYDVPRIIVVYSRWKKRFDKSLHPPFTVFDSSNFALIIYSGIVYFFDNRWIRFKKLPNQWMISFEKKKGENMVQFFP